MAPLSNGYAIQEYPRHPFQLLIDEVYRRLDTNNETGLTLIEAQEAQGKHGPNKLAGEGGVQWYSVLLKQISNAMILVSLPFIIHLLLRTLQDCSR